MLKRSPAAAGFAMLALLAMATCTSSAATSTNAVLIIDKSFDLTSADPHRDASETGALIAKALYSTLLTFEGGDQSTPVPWVAASYISSEDARTFTFKLRHDVVFSDRSQLTSADVLFSLARVVKMKGGPSALLSGVNASAPDAYTVVLTSSDPNPGLPSVLTTPELAIVNATAMNGKTNGFLDGASAGSGPYVLESFSTFSDIELVANSRYWGPKPFYRKVVVRNMDPRTQLAYIGAGKDEIALDLSPIQAATLSSVHISARAGPDIVFLFANNNPLVSSVTADKHFQNAVRYAVDYRSIVGLMGAGAVQARGIIPSSRLGAMPAWFAPRQDIQHAKSELTASGIKDPAVSLGYAADLTVSGVPISSIASMVAADLGVVGIKVKLAEGPPAAAMADYASGSEQMGLWRQPGGVAAFNSYLSFLPGGLIGLRAGWPAGSDPSLESLGIQASTTADPGTRAQLLQQMQGQLNEEGPFFPLLQPGRVIVATGGGAGLDYNPGWTLDLATVTG